MAHSPSHRPTQSATLDNLQLQSASSSSPELKQQRRMTSPLPPPPASLNLPEGPGWQQQQHRPPSPLRNGYTADSSTGVELYNPHDVDDDDDDPDSPDRHLWERSPSPTSSVSHMAATLAQRVNSFVGGITPRSPLPPMTPGLPTDAELEADAEREREKSRREAEKILNREAQERERKLLEERVLAMMENTKALPPPPSKSPNRGPPSPAGSATSSASTSWWATAKNRLIQKEKEPLTPAQQVIQDAKAKEKRSNKGKEKEQWPPNAQGTVNDPAYSNLNIPAAHPTRKPVPASPTSPTPSRPAATNMAPNLSPSPMRSVDGAASPSREAPPLYAQFNGQGVLDMPGTLLTIVRRFEKLEKWTVGHVRALEERMGDVERWLVDKEKDKEKEKAQQGTIHARGREMGADVSTVEQEVREMREEVTELSGRVSELGREVAKLVVSPSNLSNGPNRQSAQISIAPQTASAIVIHSNNMQSNVSSPSGSARISSSVRDIPITPMGSSKTSGTRLPYPTGDYASPEMKYRPQGAVSPPTGSPTSLTSASRNLPASISGLPSGGNGLSYAMERTGSNNSVTSPAIRPLNLSNGTSPFASSSNRAISPSSGLPAPLSGHGSRQSSVSPAPRKRYTVALGGSSSASDDGEGIRRAATPVGKLGMAYFSSTDDGDQENVGGSNANGGKYGGTDDESEFQDETIGKSSSSRYASAAAIAAASGAAGTNTRRTSTPGSYPVGDYKAPSDNNVSPASTTSPARKTRAQSMYGFSSIASRQSATAATTAMASYAGFNTTAPLRPRVRSRSSEPSEGDGSGAFSPPTPATATFGSAANNKFVDPLLLRKQDRERERMQIAMPRPIGKVPIGQLVAFFDGDKK